MRSFCLISVIYFCSLSVLLVTCNGSSSDAFAVSRRLAVASEADLVALITRTNTFDTPSSLTLTGDVVLTAALPLLPFNANITLKGACAGRRCIIDGQNKYPVFIANFLACTLLLENVEFRNIKGGVMVGSCTTTVKNCLFQRCTSDSDGGVFSFSGLEDEPGLVITGSTFLNNTAAGSGGAIFIERGFGSFTIFNSTFTGNAAGENGGALAAGRFRTELTSVTLRNVHFGGNSAGASGGALKLLFGDKTDMQVYGVTFAKNTAKTGTGGAMHVASDNNVFTSSFLFCNVKFTANAATTSPQSANINLVSSETSPGSLVKFCGGRPLSTNIVSTLTPSVIRVTSSCTGCSGCTDDCNAFGNCIVDPKGNGIGFCKCKGFQNPSTSCGTCLTGYAGVNCTSCNPGFTKTSKGQCAACEALVKIPELDISNYLLSSVTRSATLCQRSCRTFGFSCDKWAWFDPMSACPQSCILYADRFVCDKAQNVTFNSQYRVYYQNYQRIRDFCD